MIIKLCLCLKKERKRKKIEERSRITQALTAFVLVSVHERVRCPHVCRKEVGEEVGGGGIITITLMKDS